MPQISRSVPFLAPFSSSEFSAGLRSCLFRTPSRRSDSSHRTRGGHGDQADASPSALSRGVRARTSSAFGAILKEQTHDNLIQTD